MPKKRAPSLTALDIGGLADEWDQTPTIRQHLRDGKRLVPNADPSIKVVGENSQILMPIILRMAGGENKVPDVVPLREEIAAVYTRNKQEMSVEEVQVIEDAWTLRKFAGFVKMKCRREEVSIVVWLHFMV